jgi:hypothetical protein
MTKKHITRPSTKPFGWTKHCVLCLVTLGIAFQCYALEPEPRKWNHLPIGVNFAGVGYAYTEADIYIDPVLLLEDVKMDMNTWAGKYIRTFELFDKSARVDFTQAYQEGQWKGLLDGVPASTSRSGLSDSFVRFAVNLIGAPPLQGKEYGAYRSKVDVETIVGVALAVRLPTGEYMNDKLINLGKNRFTFRPQMGVIHTRGKWSAEITGEVAFHTENNDFYNGNKLEQKPLYITHAHLIHNFRPGLWAVASIGYDYGGETRVNGIDKNNRQQNIAWAFSSSFPINRYTGIKVSYIGSHTEELIGFDSDTFMVSLSYLW